MSQPIRSARFLAFATCVVAFWCSVPPLIVSRFTGPLGGGLILYLIFLYFALPHINTWLIAHTPFGKLWAWARVNELKLRAEADAKRTDEAAAQQAPTI